MALKEKQGVYSCALHIFLREDGRQGLHNLLCTHCLVGVPWGFPRGTYLLRMSKFVFLVYKTHPLSIGFESSVCHGGPRRPHTASRQFLHLGDWHLTAGTTQLNFTFTKSDTMNDVHCPLSPSHQSLATPVSAMELQPSKTQQEGWALVVPHKKPPIKYFPTLTTHTKMGTFPLFSQT